MPQVFAIRTANGRFANLENTSIMTVRALAAFSALAQSVTGPKGDVLRTVVVPLFNAMPQAMCRFHPKTTTDTERLKKWSATDTDYQWVDTDCITLAGLGTESVRFGPRDHEVNTPFTTNPDTWGWIQAQELLAHEKLIKAHAAACGATIQFNVLKAAVRNHVALTEGTMVLRVPDTAVDLACSKSYAIYSPEAGGYANPQWVYGTLAGARLFESPEVANTNAKKRSGCSNGTQVVEVDMSISRVVNNIGPQAINAKHPIDEALVVIHRRQIEDALKEADVEALRRRLAELEGPDTNVERAPPRKKM